MMLLRIALAFSLALLALPGKAADTAQKRYPLSDRGTLVVSVPAAWTEEVRQEDKAKPPTISYRLGAGREPQVIMTPTWPMRADTPPLTPETVRSYVEQAAKAVKDEALEKEIPITEFKGKSGTGYYFEATDKAPKAGEFKFLRQGMLPVDGLLVAFTILANSRQEPVLRDAMQLLEGAARAPQK